jgi:copper chaperone
MVSSLRAYTPLAYNEEVAVMRTSQESRSLADQEAPAARAAGQGRTYTVKGMTCDHCARSVTEEVEQVPGVAGVEVDLQGGRVDVRGDGFSDEAIFEAVEEAGYEVLTS